MSNPAYCCVTWRELSVELLEVKTDELNSLIRDKGLPRSMFASVLRVLEAMNNFCPVCGSSLVAGLTVAQHVQHNEAVTKAKETLAEVPVVERRKCAACAGRGNLGTDRNGIKTNCMKCHGEGWFEAKHVAEDGRAKFARTKVEEVREKTGLGDGQISVDPRGTT